MSWWLWALLGGVVLVALAAVFRTVSNQTKVTPPVSPGTTRVTPPPVAQGPAPATTAQKAAPTPPPSPVPPSRAGGGSPRPLPPDHAGRPHSGARCRTASRLAACSHAYARDALRPSAGRRAGATTSACRRAARRSASAIASPRTGDAGSPSPLGARRGLGGQSRDEYQYAAHALHGGLGQAG